jgi:hypothetical protein
MLNGNELGPSMPAKEPYYSRSTVGYVMVSLGIVLISSLLFTPLGNLVGKRLMDRLAPEQRPASVNIPAATSSTSDSISSENGVPQRATQITSSPRTLPLATIKPFDDDQNASLTLEYDSLKERYLAVNQSLQQRAIDLGGLPTKPEITTALGTAKADLTASELALRERNWNVATERMERAKKTLNFLESL